MRFMNASNSGTVTHRGTKAGKSMRGIEPPIKSIWGTVGSRRPCAVYKFNHL